MFDWNYHYMKISIKVARVVKSVEKYWAKIFHGWQFDFMHCYAYFLMIFMTIGMLLLSHACKLDMDTRTRRSGRCGPDPKSSDF